MSPSSPPALQSSGPGASSGPGGDPSELVIRIASLEVENQSLRGGEALGLMGGGAPPQPLLPDQHPLCPRSGAGSAAGCLQAGGPAECAREELARPPGHSSADPGEGPSPARDPRLALRSRRPSRLPAPT